MESNNFKEAVIQNIKLTLRMVIKFKNQTQKDFFIFEEELMTAKLVRNAFKKASTSVNIDSKLYSIDNCIEADFDQPTNYSLRYAEENSIIEELSNFENLIVSNELENKATTYYSEETSIETPSHFSTSTSTSDLLNLENKKLHSTTQIELMEYSIVKQNKFIKEKLENLKELGQLKTFMDFENNIEECENTNIEIYLPDDIEDFDEKCNEDRSEKIINVTPSQSPVELCNKDIDEKIVTFAEDRCSHQTPLMFSRCSSLGSLSGCEQQLLHDDHSSVVSDFSTRPSEVVSPSELPDSPAQLVFSNIQQKDKKLNCKKIHQKREKIQSFETNSMKQDILKRSIFEDDLAIFKEESTPIKFQSVTASSLSSLTIDEDDVDEQYNEKVENKASVIKTLKTNNEHFNSEEDEKKKISNNCEIFEENSYFSIDEEKILDEYIRKGIAKVTRQHLNDVSSFNLQAKTSDLNISESESLCQSDIKSNSLELFEENSDLTAEEEELLDDVIRRGIAKVTRQNINDVTSLSLRSNFTRLSTLKNSDENDKLEKEQLKHDESQKCTAIFQTE